MGKVNLAEKLAPIGEHRRPKVVGVLNRQEAELDCGEFVIVPRGVQHRTFAGSAFTAPNSVRI